jgi:hypothetical protein
MGGLAGLKGDDLWKQVRMGFGTGLGMGLITGGIMGGFEAWSNGGNFWTGKGIVQEFGVGEGPLTSNARSEQLATYYNGTERMQYVDKDILIPRMESECGYEAGMFDLQTPTTHSGKGYGYRSDGYFQNLKTGKKVGGYYIPDTREMHISYGVATADKVTFRAIVGHELIHAYHYYTFGTIANGFTEAIAYQYSYQTYANNMRWGDALSVIRNPQFSWTKYPFFYYFNP